MSGPDYSAVDSLLYRQNFPKREGLVSNIIYWIFDKCREGGTVLLKADDEAKVCWL